MAPRPETVSGFAPDRPLNSGQSPPHEIAIPCRGAMPAPSLAFGERSAELRGAPSPVLHWKLATSSARRRIYFFPAGSVSLLMQVATLQSDKSIENIGQI